MTTLPRRLAALLIALLASPLALAQPAARPADPNANFEGRNLLADQRWHDQSYGLSLLPPLGATLVKQTADDAILRIVDENKTYTMTVIVKRTRNPLTVQQAAALALENVTQVQGSTQPIMTDKTDSEGRPIPDSRSDTLGGLPAQVFYVRVPLNQKTELMYGQAVMQIDKTLFAFIDVKCELQNRQQVRPVFEAVLRGFQIADLKELDRQRQQALETGKKWRETLPLKQLHAAVVPEQWFRLVEGGRDFGYMKVLQKLVKKDGKDGIGVEVQSRFVFGADTIDSLAEYFLADDDSAELWTVKTTQRPGAAPKGPAGSQAPQNITYVETGVRLGDTITITIDSPAGRTKNEFARPPIGYLSQVESWLLPMVLPIDRPGTYGFYCYHSSQGKLLLRTDQVVPILAGYTLTTVLAPNENPMVAHFDSKRKLLEKQLGPTRVMQPTTPQMIQQLWRGR